MLDFLFKNGKFSYHDGCHIEVNGEKLLELYPYVYDVNVETSRNTAAVATIQIELFAEKDGSWPSIDNQVLKVGNEVRIDVSFQTYSELLFVGYIVDITSNYPSAGGVGSVTIRCQDETILMDQVHSRISWDDPNPIFDGAIVAQIAEKHG